MSGFVPSQKPEGQHGTMDGTMTMCLCLIRLSQCCLLLPGKTTRRNATPLSTCLPIRLTQCRTSRCILLPAQRHADTGCTAERTDNGTKDRKKRAAPQNWNSSQNETMNDTTATRHRKQSYPINKENQAAENDSTHTAPASSQSQPGYHQSTKS